MIIPKYTRLMDIWTSVLIESLYKYYIMSNKFPVINNNTFLPIGILNALYGQRAKKNIFFLILLYQVTAVSEHLSENLLSCET